MLVVPQLIARRSERQVFFKLLLRGVANAVWITLLAQASWIAIVLLLPDAIQMHEVQVVTAKQDTTLACELLFVN